MQCDIFQHISQLINIKLLESTVSSLDIKFDLLEPIFRLNTSSRWMITKWKIYIFILIFI